MKAVLTFTISDVTPNIDITNHDHGADVSIQTQELYFNVNNSVKTDTAVIDFGSLYVKGDKGDIGPLGELGILGIQGPKGDKGDKGDIGARGLTGPEGPIGPAGERGPIGPQGLQGPQGPVGERGPKGDKGDRGERGLQGLQGVQGERGEKGERGEQGAVGPVGPKGDRGEVGPVGPQGILGERGPQGERGELGIQGPIGPQGPAGDNVVIIETSVTETDGVTYVCSVEKSSTEIQQLIAQGKVCYWHVAEMNVYVLIDASWYTITGSSVDMDGQYYYIYIYRQQGNTLYGRVFQSVTLDDIPTIPTNVSEFTNDAGYLTEHLSLDNYLTKDSASQTYQPKGNYALSSNVPTKVSLLTNDKNYFGNGDILLNKSPFVANNHSLIYLSQLNNGLYASDKRYVVTHEYFNENMEKQGNLPTNIFDCNYEITPSANKGAYKYAKLYIGTVAEQELDTSAKNSFYTYTQGTYLISFYHTWVPDIENFTVEFYIYGNSSYERGWHSIDVTKFANSVFQVIIPASATNIMAFRVNYELKFAQTYKDTSDYVTAITQFEWRGTRIDASHEAVVTKHGYSQTMYGNLTVPKLTISGGKSTLFLKANGSLDSTVYLPKGDYALKSEIPTVPTKTSQLVNDSNYLITPSGDPMHYIYVSAGAEYNGTNSDVIKTAPWGDEVVHKKGMWYLNGLGDITTDEISTIYVLTFNNAMLGTNLSSAPDCSIYPAKNECRTNFARMANGSQNNWFYVVYQRTWQSATKTEVVALPKCVNDTPNSHGLRVILGSSYFCFGSNTIKHIIGIFSPWTSSNEYLENGSGIFGTCRNLETVNIVKLNKDIKFQNCSKLRTLSIAYMIRYAMDLNNIVITLHPDAYARAIADEEVLSALTAHPNVTLVSA